MQVRRTVFNYLISSTIDMGWGWGGRSLYLLMIKDIEQQHTFFFSLMFLGVNETGLRVMIALKLNDNHVIIMFCITYLTK